MHAFRHQTFQVKSILKLLKSRCNQRQALFSCKANFTVDATDGVWLLSTTGSRDPVTAALHVLVGDSMPLDIVKITGWKKTPQSVDEPPRVRYAASFAGYAFNVARSVCPLLCYLQIF